MQAWSGRRGRGYGELRTRGSVACGEGWFDFRQNREQHPSGRIAPRSIARGRPSGKQPTKPQRGGMEAAPAPAPAVELRWPLEPGGPAGLEALCSPRTWDALARAAAAAQPPSRSLSLDLCGATLAMQPGAGPTEALLLPAPAGLDRLSIRNGRVELVGGQGLRLDEPPGRPFELELREVRRLGPGPGMPETRGNDAQELKGNESPTPHPCPPPQGTGHGPWAVVEGSGCTRAPGRESGARQARGPSGEGPRSRGPWALGGEGPRAVRRGAMAIGYVGRMASYRIAEPKTLNH
jgi:hypothetical protein